MTRKHWRQIEVLLEDATTDIGEIAEVVPHNDTVRVLVSNIRRYLDSIYTVCEKDYCDDSADERPQGYEEIWTMLPNGNTLSVGDMNRLKEHIQTWKEGN